VLAGKKHNKPGKKERYLAKQVSSVQKDYAQKKALRTPPKARAGDTPAKDAAESYFSQTAPRDVASSGSIR